MSPGDAMSAAPGPSTGVYMHPELKVPVRDIRRLRYPDEITPQCFERDFAASSEPCIIEGLIDDWPAFADAERTWRGDRWDKMYSQATLDCGFDPVDNRMMHFGDDDGDPSVLLNPGRLRMPVWAFLEVARLRQCIMELHQTLGTEERLDLRKYPELKKRLNCQVTVQNVPFLSADMDSPLYFFKPVECRIRDLVPFAYYLSHDTYALPPEMQSDLGPQAPKLMAGWANPNSSRIWVSNGGPWRMSFPPWSEDSCPQPPDDNNVYSCFHCDRMENLHSLIAGEKFVVLVPPGQRDVLKATRYSTQRQWLLAPVSSHTGQSYLGSTLFTSKQVECTSDQSAVHPLRPPEDNRRVSSGQWPDEVDFPIRVGRLKKGDTLYIPAYHWHWVATSTPPALGLTDDGPLAMSVNFWWWPVHNDAAMEQWSYQNECESWQNARIPVPPEKQKLDREAHAISFFHLTARMRQESSQPVPCPTPTGALQDPISATACKAPTRTRDASAKRIEMHASQTADHEIEYEVVD